VNEQQLEHTHVRNRLLERHDALLQRVRSTSQDEEELLTDSGPELEEISACERDAGVLERLGERERVALRRIDAAISRLDDETYGRCLGCGTMVARERLEAMPEAELCHDCQEDQESTG
jgi:RNA polymerase-binding protein DksA